MIPTLLYRSSAGLAIIPGNWSSSKPDPVEHHSCSVGYSGEASFESWHCFGISLCTPEILQYQAVPLESAVVGSFARSSFRWLVTAAGASCS